MVSVQRLGTLRDLVYVARILERIKEEEQKSRGARSQAKVKIDEKTKGKKTLQTYEQGKARGGDAKRHKPNQRNDC